MPLATRRCEVKTPNPPAPPDPAATAAAQTASNVKTATTQQQLNMVDQTNPYGSVAYTQTGKWEDGTPKFAANTTLSPEEMRNQRQQWEFDNLTNDLGINQTKKLTDHLGKPIELGNEATEARLMELGRKRMDPMFADRRSAMETKLYNQGVMPGTEAYDREMLRLTEGENDAYNSLLLAGRGQAVQEGLTARNQPINEITALMSGGQVTQPNFTSTPQTNVAGTDIAGLTMDAYKMGPLANWQAQNANRQAMMGGIFGLAGTGARAAMGGWGKAA
jgi:hypothetical protein